MKNPDECPGCGESKSKSLGALRSKQWFWCGKCRGYHSREATAEEIAETEDRKRREIEAYEQRCRELEGHDFRTPPFFKPPPPSVLSPNEIEAQFNHNSAPYTTPGPTFSEVMRQAEEWARRNTDDAR